MYQFEEIAKIDIVHFCGITLAMNDYGTPSYEVFSESELKKSGGTVVFDCNYRPSLWEKTDMNRQNRIMKKC